MTETTAAPWWSWSRIRALDNQIIDPALAAFLLVAGITGAASGQIDATHPRPIDGFAYLLTVVGFGVLAVRTRWTIPTFVVSIAATTWYAALEYPENGLPLGCMVALYTVAARCSRRDSLLAGATVLAAICGLTAAGAQGLDVAGGLSNVAFFGVAYAVGRYVQVRRAYLDELELKAQAQEEQRRREAEQAVAEERLRIARELHDVVAHAMSVVAVQSGVAAHVIDQDPAQAHAMLDTINGMSREALTEMRRLLGVLRADGDEPPTDLTPAPTLADLPSLVSSVEGTGVTAALHVEGDAPNLSPGLDLAAYRVVQEALTNVVRHAGPAQVDVRVRYGSTSVEIDVVDDGRGAASSSAEAAGGGHGLTGMRERVDLYGGTLAAGPRPGGGFAVSASLPYEQDSVPA